MPTLYLAAYDAFDPAALIRSTLVLDAEDAVRFAPRVLRGYTAGPVSGFFLCPACFASATGAPPDARAYTPVDGAVVMRRVPRTPLSRLQVRSERWARRMLAGAASFTFV